MAIRSRAGIAAAEDPLDGFAKSDARQNQLTFGRGILPAMKKSDIDTPALILDLDVAEENIRAMGAYFAARPQKLRPHFKTPKTPEIARRQLAAGAIGITASKLGEVEVLARAGLGPVLLANQIAGA